MKTMIAILLCLVMMTPVLAESLGKYDIYQWKCDGCDKVSSSGENKPPDGWIEVAGGFTCEDKTEFYHSDFWPSPSITYEQCTVEKIHFCPVCRDNPTRQLQLGRRLMESGWWDEAKKPMKVKETYWITIPGDSFITTDDCTISDSEWKNSATDDGGSTLRFDTGSGALHWPNDSNVVSHFHRREQADPPPIIVNSADGKICSKTESINEKGEKITIIEKTNGREEYNETTGEMSSTLIWPSPGECQ